MLLVFFNIAWGVHNGNNTTWFNENNELVIVLNLLAALCIVTKQENWGLLNDMELKSILEVYLNF